MIARFWDALFDYADEAKANNDKVRYEISHEIEAILQIAYDEGMDRRSMVENWHPKTQVGKLVASIPDIEVYKDPNDGKLFWELDGHVFDYQEEVIKYLIDFRSNKAVRDMDKFKAKFLKAVQESIEDFSSASIFAGKRRRIHGEEEK